MISVTNFLIIFPLFVASVTSIYISIGEAGSLSAEWWANIVRILGVLPGLSLLLLLFLTIYFSGAKYKITSPLLMAVSLSSIFILSIQLCASLLGDNDFNYTIGDYYRSILPYFALIVFNIALSSERKIMSFASSLKVFLIYFAIIGAITKIYLVVFLGNFYGGWSNQYYIGSFLLTYLFVKYSKKISWKFVSIISLVLLSILSLKRGIWISIVFVFLTILLSRNLVKKLSWIRLSIVISATIVILSVLVPGELMDLAINSVVSRLEYTFGGNDGSVAGRLNEWYNVKEILENGSVENLFFGYGHGSEFFDIYKTGGMGSMDGSVHHIHSTWVLLLFRNGLVGVFMYMVLFLGAVKIFVLYWNDTFKRPFIVKKEVWLLGFSASVELMVQMMNSIQGNIAYGSVYFSIFLFLAVALRRILIRELHGNLVPS